MKSLETALDEAFGEPTPKQEEFFRAKTRYVGYGGSRGGGKSHAVRAKSTFLALEHPGIKILVVRKTITDLRRNYVRPLQIAFMNFPKEIQPTYSESEKIFYFPNGSTIEMGYCDIDADADRYRGNEWDVLFLDEATELSEYQYGVLNSCVRGVNRFPKRTYLTCNPGGIGHDNVMRLFIERKYRRHEKASNYTFIPARVWDNLPLLMSDEGFKRALTEYKRKYHPKVVDEAVIKACMYESDYVQTLDNLPEAIREAQLNGDWYVFSGKFFSEWDPDVHVVEPFKIPKHWRKTASLDYGLDKFAVLWYATDEKGFSVCYRGCEYSNLIIASAALMFRELSREEDGSDEKIDMILAPPDLWNRRQDTGKSAADIFAENGVPLIKAGNDRVAGWLNVKEYLKYERDDTGRVTTPPKMVFFNICEKIIEYIPKLQFNVKKPNDVMTEPHEITHSPDALRYRCSVWQLAAEVKVVEKQNPFATRRPKRGWEVPEEYLIGGYS